jgi:hypothetical protein
MTARGYLRSAEAAGLTMIIRWCMGVMQPGAIRQEWQNGRSRSETERDNGRQKDFMAIEQDGCMRYASGPHHSWAALGATDNAVQFDALKWMSTVAYRGPHRA